MSSKSASLSLLNSSMQLLYSFHLVLLLFNCCFLSVNTSSLTDDHRHKDFQNKTTLFNRNQAKLTKSGFTQILFSYIDSNVNQLDKVGVTKKCINSLVFFNRSIENGQPWAFKMLDASGRAPIDFTGLGYLAMGNFDQCLQLTWTNSSGLDEMGQYCLASVEPNPPEPGTIADIFTSIKVLSKYDPGYSMKIGFCIPSSCSQADFQIILSRALEPFSWAVPQVDSCQVKTSFTEKLLKAPSFQKVCFSLLATFVFLVIYSTWKDVTRTFDIDTKSTKSIDNHWSRNFALSTNWKNMIEPDREMKKCPTLIKKTLVQHVVVLHFHGLIWPVVHHAIIIYALGNPLVRHRDSAVLQSLFGDWFTDGLFALASISRSLELWSKITPNTSIWRIVNMITKKMLILTCLLVLMIAVESVIPLFSDGPFSAIAEKRADICSRTFTANLFFYHNYIGSLDKVCVGHSWSLAAEYQLVFFLAGLVILYKRLPKLALRLNIIAIIGGLIYAGLVFYINDFPPHAISRGFDPSSLSKWLEFVYLPASMKFWIYMIGPLCTYLIMKQYRFKILENRRNSKIILWTFPLLMMFLSCFWSLTSAYHSPMWAAVYAITYRTCSFAFYWLLILHNADEYRAYFSMENDNAINSDNNSSITSANNNNNNNNNNNEKEKISPIKNHNQPPRTRDEKIAEHKPGKFEYKILHIATAIFKSTYCVHAPVLIWYYSQHRLPVLTTVEWIFHLFGAILMSILTGIVFYFFCLGPFSNLAETVKSNAGRSKLDQLKNE